MGLYIKGAKMPKNCWVCPCYNKEYLICQVTESCCEYEKPNNCPLVELPPKHGRLIDADEMKELWKGCTFEGDITCLLDPRPTVLEAEGD
jgi:hypothetical protein